MDNEMRVEVASTKTVSIRSEIDYKRKKLLIVEMVRTVDHFETFSNRRVYRNFQIISYTRMIASIPKIEILNMLCTKLVFLVNVDAVSVLFSTSLVFITYSRGNFANKRVCAWRDYVESFGDFIDATKREYTTE